ncbi:MAG: hypothetical protein AAFS10_15175 [Myxococcota bacterium]
MPLHHTLMTRIRHFCHAEPSARAWAGICSVMQSLENHNMGDDMAMIVDYVMAHTQDWPVTLKQANCDVWLGRLAKGEAPPAWPIIQAVDLDLSTLKRILSHDNGARHLTELRVVHLHYRPIPPDDVPWQTIAEVLRPGVEQLSLEMPGVPFVHVLELFEKGPWPKLHRLRIGALNFSIHTSATLMRLEHLLNARRLPALETVELASIAGPLRRRLFKGLVEHGCIERFEARYEGLDTADVQILMQAKRPLTSIWARPRRLRGEELSWVLERLDASCWHEEGWVHLSATEPEHAHRQVASAVHARPSHVLVEAQHTEFAEALAKADFTGVTSLEMFPLPGGGPWAWSEEAWTRFCTAPWLGQLHRLSLTDAELGDSWMEVLVDGLTRHGRPALRELTLQSCGPLDTDALMVLLKALPELEMLKTPDWVPDGRLAEATACCSTQTQLHILDLYNPPPERSDCLAAVSHQATAHMFYHDSYGHSGLILDQSWSSFVDDEVSAALLHTFRDKPLKSIDLGFGEQTAAVLAEGGGWSTSLHHLRLRMETTTADALEALDAVDLPPEVAVTLSGELTDAQFQAMVRWRRPLGRLDLWMDLTPHQLTLLGQSPLVTQLDTLVLHGHLTCEQAEALAGWSKGPRRLGLRGDTRLFQVASKASWTSTTFELPTPDHPTSGWLERCDG